MNLTQTRGIATSMTAHRKQIFTEVARLAYEGGDYSRIEDLPYKIAPGDMPEDRESIFLERAIIGERIRLAMGLPLRSVTEHTRLSDGVNESAIAEKYYDPPLVNIISYACNACPTNRYYVTEGCQGCRPITAMKCAPAAPSALSRASLSLTRPSVSSAVSAPMPAPTMPSSSRSAPALPLAV